MIIQPWTPFDNMRKVHMHKCCVCFDSKEVGSKRQLHTIPKDDRIKLLWEAAVEMKLSIHKRICSDHFKPDQYIATRSTRRSLKKTAVPSLHLKRVESNADSDKLQMLRRGMAFGDCSVEEVNAAFDDIESAPDTSKASVEEKRCMELDARGILEIFQSQEFQKSLQVLDLTKTVREECGFGPFALFPSLQGRLLMELQKYEMFYHSNDIFTLFLRESMIMAVMKLKNMSLEDAKEYFNVTSRLVQEK